MGILDLLSTGNQYADPNGLYAGLMGHKGIAGYFENASNPAAMATQRPPQDGWEPGGQYPQGMPNAPPAAAAPHKPGFFGRGGAAWGILGSLSDAAAVAGGGQPYFGEDIRRQREKRMDRQNVMDQWVAEQEYKDAHKDLPAEQQNWQAYMAADEPTRAMIDKYRTQSAPRFVIDPSGQGGFVSPTSAAPATSGPPAPAIEMLRKNPALAPHFREKYGVDPALYLGGAGPSGPQTFR